VRTLAGQWTDPVETPKGRRSPGELGTWLFLSIDLSFFGVMFGAFLHERGRSAEEFHSSARELNPWFGLAMTAVLITSSALVFAALVPYSARLRPHALTLIDGALGLGLVFCALKAVEWSLKVSAGFGPRKNAFFTYYFDLTAIHLVHVVIGLGFLLAIRESYVRTQRSGESVAERDPAETSRRAPSDESRQALIEGGACYWHMVDLVWVILFPLLYLAS